MGGGNNQSKFKAVLAFDKFWGWVLNQYIKQDITRFHFTDL